MALIYNKLDNEYVRRVGFALSFLSGSPHAPHARRLNPFALLLVLVAAGFAALAVLACLR